MEIGVPRERKTDESRVALCPDQAAILTAKGHNVFVETCAGVKSGFSDDHYIQAGAKIVSSSEIYSNCKLIVKVKCPLESEYEFYSPQHVLFTYLHFDENIKPGNIMRIVNRGLTAIAYEWVREGKPLPLLEPMSELTGAVFARKSMALLMEHKGHLGGSYIPAWPGATAMVIGAGHIGANAINVFIQNKFKIIVVDKHPHTLLGRLSKYIPSMSIAAGNLELIEFDENDAARSCGRVRELLSKTDIVICAAVRRQTLPKDVCPYIITSDDLQLMSPNSVMCDATACDKDLVESCVSSESLTHTYVENNVIHYNCDHIPALVPHTSTRILTSATFPYVEMLADGAEDAFAQSASLGGAVMCRGGVVTHEYCARKKGLDFMPLANTLSSVAIHTQLEGAAHA